MFVAVGAGVFAFSACVSGGSGARAGQPGGLIAFFRQDRSYRDRIFVMNADGTGQRPLTRLAADAFGPSLSPDGKRIAFVTGGDSLAVMRTDGSNRRILLPLVSAGPPLSWSPDGRKIAFEESLEHSIDVVNANGSGHRVLRRNAFDPAWSPDGKKIAFVNGRLELWLMNANGTGAHRLLNTGCGVGDPAWSPDGKKIAFVRGLLEGEIYIVDADGTDRYVLPSDPRLGLASPEWSPDGTKLAYTGHIPYAFAQAIYVSNADGRELTQITHGTRDFDPSWR